MGNKKGKILVAEDERIDQIAFERFIKKEKFPYDYVIAGSVKKAKIILEKEKFDAVVLDYMLGDGTAFDLFDKVKGAPIIIVTGGGGEEIAVQAMKAGAYDYLIKDPEGNYLKTLPLTVENAIKHKLAEDALFRYQEHLEEVVRDRTSDLTKLNKKLLSEIKERQRIDEALQESERKYRALVDNSLVGIYITQNHIIKFCNQRFAEIFGYQNPKELIGIHTKKLVTPEDWELVDREVKTRETGRVKTSNYEFRGLKKDGTIVDIEVLGSRIDYDGKPAIQGTLIDITKRKHAEATRQESERRYRLLAENLTDIIWTMDKDLKFSYISPSVTRILGYSVKEVKNMSLRDILTPSSLSVIEKTISEKANREKEKSQSKTLLPTMEVEFKTKDGSTNWFEVSLIFPPDQTETSWEFLGVARDICERKKAEEEKEKIRAQLFQAQKMEAIGILAGGIAHDFNNLLTAIQGCADMELMDVDESTSSYQNLKEIRDAADRAAELTRQLLFFSRKHPMEPVPLNFNKTIEDLLKILHRLIGEDIAITTDLEPDLWTVYADRGTMEQVIMNLAVNARDAMPGGGRLTIKTENVVLDEVYCNVIPKAQCGEFVRITVEDTGIGMGKEVLKHIFEPFFSTKGPGKGTGLGLSVVYGIIRQHNGWINTYSEPDQGTTFRIYLPAVHIKSEEQNEKLTSAEELKGNGEQILIVEDEEGVREFTRRALEKGGYTVFVAVNAWEALDIFEKVKNLDLVFSDVVLPDKTGIDLAEELLARKPELKILLTSGYTDQKSQWPIIQKKGFKFLQKPYALLDLLQTIKEVINSH